MRKKTILQMYTEMLFQANTTVHRQKLREIARKLDPKKIPKSFKLPSEYIIDRHQGNMS